MSNPQMVVRPDLNLGEHFAFRPRWWWDPVPDWFVQAIDKPVLKEIAVTQIQLQKTVLEAQLKATEQVLGILGKGR